MNYLLPLNVILYRPPIDVPKRGINLTRITVHDGQHLEMFECPAYQQNSEALYETIDESQLDLSVNYDYLNVTSTSHDTTMDTRADNDDITDDTSADIPSRDSTSDIARDTECTETSTIINMQTWNSMLYYM